MLHSHLLLDPSTIHLPQFLLLGNVVSATKSHATVSVSKSGDKTVSTLVGDDAGIAHKAELKEVKIKVVHLVVMYKKLRLYQVTNLATHFRKKPPRHLL